MIYKFNNNLKILVYYVKTVISKSLIFKIILIFILLTYLSKQHFHNLKDNFSIFKIFFNFPDNLTNDIYFIILWSCYQIYLIYLLANFIYQELNFRIVNIISKIGNKKKWITFIHLNLFIIILIYYSIGIIISIYIFKINLTYDKLLYIINNLLYITFINYLMSIIYMILIFTINKYEMSFLIIIIFIYLFIFMKSIFFTNNYLINSNIYIQYICIILLIIVNHKILNEIINKKDLIYYTIY